MSSRKMMRLRSGQLRLGRKALNLLAKVSENALPRYTKGASRSRIRLIQR
jgi:hypothetical protein